MTDYSVYCFTKKEWLFEIGQAAGILCFTGLLFFGNAAGCLLLFPMIFFLVKERKDKKKEQRLSELRNDFKEFVTSFSSSIQAGYTIDQAVRIGMDDLKRLYPKGNRVLLAELAWMNQQIKLQIPCDELFSNLAKRSGIEEIRSFAVVLGISRKQGGNLVQITRRTAEHISRKLQVQMEMEQTIAGKTMEKKIMFLMPYFMILYLKLTNPSYMDILFSGLYGHAIMAACLILLWISGKWADRIVQIKI